jgi:hypothetical protein
MAVAVRMPEVACGAKRMRSPTIFIAASDRGLDASADPWTRQRSDCH